MHDLYLPVSDFKMSMHAFKQGMKPILSLCSIQKSTKAQVIIHKKSVEEDVKNRLS